MSSLVVQLAHVGQREGGAMRCGGSVSFVQSSTLHGIRSTLRHFTVGVLIASVQPDDMRARARGGGRGGVSSKAANLISAPRPQNDYLVPST